jgi:hypothetical protein
MADQSGATGFSVDEAIFEELRSLYSGILENVGSVRGLMTEAGNNDTGSPQVAALLQQLMRNVGEFLSETSTNLTCDRDGLATARDNYRASDGRASNQSRGLLDMFPLRVPWLPGGFPFSSTPFGESPVGLSPVGITPTPPRRRVSGPVDAIVTPGRTAERSVQR